MQKRTGTITKEDANSRRQTYLNELELVVQQFRTSLGMDSLDFQDHRKELTNKFSKQLPNLQDDILLTKQVQDELETFVYLLVQCVSQPQLRRNYCQLLLDGATSKDRTVLTACEKLLDKDSDHTRCRMLFEHSLRIKSILASDKPPNQHMLLHNERERQAYGRRVRMILTSTILRMLGHIDLQLIRLLKKSIK